MKDVTLADVAQSAMRAGAKFRRRVETCLDAANGVHGKGMMRAVVWHEPYTGAGVMVRQFQYGMDAVQFMVSADFLTVRVLGKVRPIL